MGRRPRSPEPISDCLQTTDDNAHVLRHAAHRFVCHRKRIGCVGIVANSCSTLHELRPGLPMLPGDVHVEQGQAAGRVLPQRPQASVEVDRQLRGEHRARLCLAARSARWCACARLDEGTERPRKLTERSRRNAFRLEHPLLANRVSLPGVAARAVAIDDRSAIAAVQ